MEARNGDTLFIATPLMVRDYMKKIPKRKSRSIPQMRDDLAKIHKANGTCPLTSSIFARIVAEAALEDIKAGKNVGTVTPFWRLIDKNNPIAKKLTCGPEFVGKKRKEEGLP